MTAQEQFQRFCLRSALNAEEYELKAELMANFASLLPNCPLLKLLDEGELDEVFGLAAELAWLDGYEESADVPVSEREYDALLFWWENNRPGTDKLKEAASILNLYAKIQELDWIMDSAKRRGKDFTAEASFAADDCRAEVSQSLSHLEFNFIERYGS